ncbi:MAG TPA: DUF3617 family protein [Cellvibrionaceae bacterium]|nr:DUF3617 family protein [Cellvibrionaceae bacterium]
MSKINIGKLKTLLVSLGVLTQVAVAEPVKQGQWESRSQVWIDGKEVLQQLHAAGDEIIKNARARMPADQRAQFDQQMAAARKDAGSELECIGPKEASMTPEAIAEQSIKAVHQPPWQCSISEKKIAADGFSYQYSCRTSAGGASDGTVSLSLHATSYRFEVVGTGHAVNGETGAVLGSTKMPLRSLTQGHWVSDKCDASTEDHDMGAEDDAPPAPKTKHPKP